MRCCCKSSTKTGTSNKKNGQKENNEKRKPINYDDLPIETRTLNDGSVYVGTTLDGKLHGKGVLKYKNGEEYEGEFYNGKKDGMGKWKDLEGDSYEGQWSNDRKHGHGIYKTKEGFMYEGKFESNMRHGLGTVTAPDNTKYTCNFTNDVESGEAEFFFANGDHALGYINEGYLHKNGRYEFKNGDIYVGNFEKGLFHGKGYYKWADSSHFSYYEGNYFQGKKHGSGILTSVDGTILCGEFKDNYIDGEFLTISPQGIQTKVLYSKNNHVKILEKFDEKINIKEVLNHTEINTTIFSDPDYYKNLYKIPEKKKAMFRIQLKNSKSKKV
ncbi:conserved Plasmodium protein, unknown function [Plasmodium chabaudi adami]|uniref:MORN repeat protein n=1 Tax=Plasmodium chabaudi adami TaxID=5826 RepID=A0A1C6XV22_PLACE|nr:conserved Plasmodium protein, unknown function [Plasmodium chabaudi adami]